MFGAASSCPAHRDEVEKRQRWWGWDRGAACPACWCRCGQGALGHWDGADSSARSCRTVMGWGEQGDGHGGDLGCH